MHPSQICTHLKISYNQAVWTNAGVTLSNVKRSAIVVLFALTLTACTDTRSNTKDVAALPEETQRAAYAECAKELRLPLHVHKLKRGYQGLHVQGSDGSGVLVAEARALNQCARTKLSAGIAAS